MTQAATGLHSQNPRSSLIHLIRRSWFSCATHYNGKFEIDIKFESFKVKMKNEKSSTLVFNTGIENLTCSNLTKINLLSNQWAIDTNL